MNGSSRRIFVLSGESGVGKTTLCVATVALLQRAGAIVAGVVSPTRFEEGRKTGIFVQDIRSGERRLLAERGNHAGLGWSFDPDALKWGSGVLQAALPCDVLLVDELGPLELKQEKGWTVAWSVLNSRRDAAAVVVIRPSLIGSFREQLGGQDVEVITVVPTSPSAETVSKLVLASIGGRK